MNFGKLMSDMGFLGGSKSAYQYTVEAHKWHEVAETGISVPLQISCIY